MEWLTSNWIWLGAALLMFALLWFGQGGHGCGHRHTGNRHDHGADRRPEASKVEDAPRPQKPEERGNAQELATAGHSHDAAGAPEMAGTTEHSAHGSRQAETGKRRHRHSC